MSLNDSENPDFKIVEGRSELTHAVLTADTRLKKAKKIQSILSSVSQPAGKKLLDIGTGSGHIAQAFTDYGYVVSSVDLYDLRAEPCNYEFKTYDGKAIPYHDASFDLVISNHVIEHVEDQQKHIDEIYRLLKPGGVCYLSTPSKYALLEPHYRLPFLSWFARETSSRYLKFFRNKNWDIKPLKVQTIRKLVRQRFAISNMAPLVMKYPEQYSLDMMPTLHGTFKLLPLYFWRLFCPLLPTIILIMHKKH